MGYCYPVWVSDYTYKALFDRVSFVSKPKQIVTTTDTPISGTYSLSPLWPNWRNVHGCATSLPSFAIAQENAPAAQEAPPLEILDDVVLGDPAAPVHLRGLRTHQIAVSRVAGHATSLRTVPRGPGRPRR